MDFSSQIVRRSKKNIENPRRIEGILGMFFFAMAFIWTTRLFRGDIWETLGKSFLILEMLFFGICTIGILLAIRYAFNKKWKIEKIFLLCYIPCSLLMMCVLPITRAPDEVAHLIRAYLLSTGQFVPGKSIPFVYPDNLLENINRQNVTIHDLALMKNLTLSGNMVDAGLGLNTAIYPINSYFPQAFGMAIISVFTNNRLAILYGGRVASWIASLLLFYYAIKIAPKGKGLLFMLFMMPMTLQEAISLSADGMTIGVVALFSSCFMRAYMNPHIYGKREKIGWFILALGLATFKVMYFPLVFILVFLPEMCFENKKEKQKSIAIIIGGAILCLAGWAVYCYFAYFNSSQNQVVSDTSSGMGRQISMILTQPLHVLSVMIQSIEHFFDNWIYTGIGSSLSWFNIPISSIVYLPIAYLIICRLTKDREGNKITEECDIYQKINRGFWISTVLSTLVVMIFLLVWWTDSEAQYIDGIQGRYFIPICIMLFFALISKRKKENEIQITEKECSMITVLAICSVINTLVYTLI